MDEVPVQVEAEESDGQNYSYWFLHGSEAGEVSQVCSSMGINFCAVQQTPEKIQLVMAHLGIKQGTKGDTSEDGEMGTKELLDELL